jgi:hypothetical protein
MSRNSLLLAIGIVLLLVGSVAGALALLVTHEPGFYRRCEVPPGLKRTQNSGAFVSEFIRFCEEIKSHRQTKWYAAFTDDQINSYFAENFVSSHTDQVVLPKGISAPRVAIEADKIRLGFRYGQDTWSTIISIDLRVWLAKKDTNVVALELQGLHAGSLPISAQSLLDRISEACQRNNIDVKWYRHNGNPVALLHFPSDSPRPLVQLTKIELRKGLLVIGCRSIPAVSPATALVTRLVQLAQLSE